MNAFINFIVKNWWIILIVLLVLIILMLLVSSAKAANKPTPPEDKSKGTGNPITGQNNYCLAPCMFPIKQGSKCKEVGDLQKFLNQKYNVGLSTDCNWGPKTQAALVNNTGKTQINSESDLNNLGVVQSPPTGDGTFIYANSTPTKVYPNKEKSAVTFTLNKGEFIFEKDSETATMYSGLIDRGFWGGGVGRYYVNKSDSKALKQS